MVVLKSSHLKPKAVDTPAAPQCYSRSLQAGPPGRQGRKLFHPLGHTHRGKCRVGGNIPALVSPAPSVIQWSSEGGSREASVSCGNDLWAMHSSRTPVWLQCALSQSAVNGSERECAPEDRWTVQEINRANNRVSFL